MRKSWLLALAVSLVILGVVLPAFVIIQFLGRDELPEAQRTLTAQEQRGMEVFADRCASCHTLAASRATAKVGPNLDVLQPSEELVLDAIRNGRSRGNGQMAADLVEGEDAEAVAAYVALVAGGAED